MPETSTVTVEICTDSVAGARAAATGGADRVELCSSLLEGGLTPSLGLIRGARSAARDIDLIVLIRPRGGDFVYEADDVSVMADDIALALEAGADGVAIGALTPDGDVDGAVMGRLVDAARGLPVTFHRAFDHTRDPFAALASLSALGCRRLLTSGGRGTALEGAESIAALVRRAPDGLEVIAGGGVRPDHAARLVAATGVHAIHATARTETDGPMRHRNPACRIADSRPADDHTRRPTTPERVRALVAAIERRR